MADPKRPADSGDKAPAESAFRPKASTTAQIIRESDMMRSGSDAVLTAIETGSASLLVNIPVQPNEQIKVRLRNVVQRFDKDIRGTVRKVSPGPGGSTLVELELYNRLTPLEVSTLKMGVGAATDAPSSQWL